MSTSQRFSVAYPSRRDAGRELAQHLLAHRGSGAVVLALSPASVPVADELAAALELPLDVFLVRSVPLPGYEGMSMGWVARGAHVVDKGAIDQAGISLATFLEAATGEQAELERHEGYCRGNRPAAPLAHRTVIVVTEGLTKESQLPSAIEALRRHAPAKVIVAAPVAVPALASALRKLVDELVVGRELGPTTELEAWYGDTEEVDDEVVRLTLHRAAERHP